MANAITPLIQQYTVDFASNNNFLFVKGIQGDGHSTRYVDISLMNNGQPYTINEEAVTVVIRGTKPDTTAIFNRCDILDNNTIRVEITQQMSAVAGRGNYEISIMSNLENRTLTSFPFFIIISKSSFDIGYVVSSDEFKLLIEKINQVLELQTDVTNAEAQRNKNETARINAENIRNTNENTRKSNENTRISNENGRKNAETARVNAENARNTAETNRNNAEAQRNASENTRIANENTRKSNENTRISNENGRKNAETARVNAENARNDAEEERENQEAIRQANEKIRQQQETKRQTDTATAITNANNATASANTATNRANAISTDLENKVATGYYKGEPGKDGVITTLEINQLAFQIEGDDLILYYEIGNTDAQKFSINSEGDMIYTLST